MVMNKVKKDNLWAAIKLAVVFVLILMSNVVSYYVNKEESLPNIVLKLNLLCVFLLVPYISIKHGPNRIINNLTLCFGLMLLMSLFHFSSELSLLTVFVIFCLMVFGTYSKEWNVEFLNLVYIVIGLFLLPILVWQLSQSQIDMGDLLKRRYTWTEIFAYATLTKIWVPMIMLSFLTKKGLMFSLLFWVIAVIFNLISLKRSIIVDSALVFGIILLVSRKIADKKIKKYLYVGLVFFFAIGVYFIAHSGYLSEINDISEAMSDRFSDTTEDVGEFDRWVESKNYFTKEATIIDDLLGKGWFSVQHGIVNRDRGHAFLHIGWLNFIFKGGIFFLITILIGYRRVFRVIFHPNCYSHEKIFEAMFCTFYFFNFFYGHVMSLGIDLFIYFYCLVHVNDRIIYSDKNLLINQTIQG